MTRPVAVLQREKIFGIRRRSGANEDFQILQLLDSVEAATQSNPPGMARQVLGTPPKDTSASSAQEHDGEGYREAPKAVSAAPRS